MKNSEAYVLMALGIAIAYFATKPKRASGSSSPSFPAGGPMAIDYGTPNGWQYFSNGTAIAPDGTYYYQGQPVWNPTM